jgi:hypothetical protein
MHWHAIASSDDHMIIICWLVDCLPAVCALLLLISVYVCVTDMCWCLLKHQLILAVILWIMCKVLVH